MQPTVKLADGRTLAWTEYGDPDGAPVVVMDGPGSRGLARAAGPAAAALGARLIAPDRPGFLGSSPKPGRAIADFPADLAVLLDAAGVDSFGLLAQSGGTPYALAVATAMPERVRALAFCGAIMPFTEPGALDEVGGPMLPAFKLGRRAPWLLRRLMKFSARNPEKAAERALRDLPPVDAALMEDPEMRAINADVTAEVMGYTDELVNELRLLWKPWAVDLGAVRAPVSFWVGARDLTHPPVMSRWLAERLGDAPVHVVPDAWTFGLKASYPQALRFATGGRQSAASASTSRPRAKKSQTSTTLPSGSST